MVSDEQIKKWKDEHGSVYLVEYPEFEIYFKALSRNDYIEIMQQSAMDASYDHEFDTVKRCILNDITENTLHSKSGVVTVVYEQIMQKSGFLVVEAREL